MGGFDIASLSDFSPANYFCRKCLALLTALEFLRSKKNVCPVCKVEYLPTGEYSYIFTYLSQTGYVIEFENLMEHCQDLARIATDMRKMREYYPPLRCLFAALNRAQQFVHFTTFGISHIMIGALKMAAQRVRVRGIVSGADSPQTVQELTEYKHEAPYLQVKVYGAETDWRDMPHQKLVVIDGLIAFKGSANLTLSGWRKAAKDRDEIEVVTGVDLVISHHNRFFSPIWAELGDIGETITMERDVPF